MRRRLITALVVLTTAGSLVVAHAADTTTPPATTTPAEGIKVGVPVTPPSGVKPSVPNKALEEATKKASLYQLSKGRYVAGPRQISVKAGKVFVILVSTDRPTRISVRKTDQAANAFAGPAGSYSAVAFTVKKKGKYELAAAGVAEPLAIIVVS